MELCRLCFTETPLHLYRTVFNSASEPPLLDIITKLTNLNISKDDHSPYPKVMCLNCYDKLMDFHDFLQVILDTDLKFREKFNNVNQYFVQHLVIKQENCVVDDNHHQKEINEVIETKTSICENIEDFHVAATVKEEIHEDEYGNYQEASEVSSFIEATASITETFNCNICNTTFSNQSELNQHKKLHININPYTCDICKKEFAVKRYLTKHMKTHLDEEPSKCDICDRQFLRKDTLRKHKKVHTDDNKDKIYTCDTCDQVFTQFLEFREHKQLHSDKLYECNVCGKRFINRAHSMRHVKIHFGQKSHECNVCGEKFTQKSSLIRHFRVHSNGIETDKRKTVNEQL